MKFRQRHAGRPALPNILIASTLTLPFRKRVFDRAVTIDVGKELGDG
jgi:hypothetical protein